MFERRVFLVRLRRSSYDQIILNFDFGSHEPDSPESMAQKIHEALADNLSIEEMEELGKLCLSTTVQS